MLHCSNYFQCNSQEERLTTKDHHLSFYINQQPLSREIATFSTLFMSGSAWSRKKRETKCWIILCTLVSVFMKRHPNHFMIVNLHKTRLKEKKVSISIIQFLYLFQPCKKRLLWAKLTYQFLARFPVFSHGIQVHPMPYKLLITSYIL